MKTHDSGTRPHRCELCNQTFPIPKDWYSHLRSSHRSRTANATTLPSSSLSTANATTTVTKPLFSNSLASQQQHNEIFIPNKVKLEPINRSQLVVKASNGKKRGKNVAEEVDTDDDNDDDDEQEPVNMSKKEDLDVDEDDEEIEENENHHQSTRNLLTNVPSSVHA